MPLILEYPPHIMAELQKPLTPEAREKRDARVAWEKQNAAERERVWREERAAEAALKAEKEAAFNWCRANGNPHLGETT